MITTTWRALRHTSALAYVSAGGYTGWQAASTIGSIVGVCISIGSLSLYVASSARTKRRDYEQELRDAKQAGINEQKAETQREHERAEQYLKDLEFYRQLAWNRQYPGQPVPPEPPSRRRRQQPQPPVPREGDDPS